MESKILLQFYDLILFSLLGFEHTWDQSIFFLLISSFWNGMVSAMPAPPLYLGSTLLANFTGSLLERNLLRMFVPGVSFTLDLDKLSLLELLDEVNVF